MQITLKKLSFVAAFCALIFCTIGCKKYEPQYQGAWTDAQATDKSIAINPEIVYMGYIDNKIYLTDRYFSKIKQVSENLYTDVTQIVLSPKRDKIAFLDGFYNLRIIDTAGRGISSLYTPNLKYIEWHSNNTLLYGVQNNRMTALYGGGLPVGLPQIPSGTVAGFGYITPENDLFYSKNSALVYTKNGQTNAQSQLVSIGTLPTIFRKPNNLNIGTTTAGNSYNITFNNRSITATNQYSYGSLWLEDGNSMNQSSGNLRYYLTEKNKFWNADKYVYTYIFDVK